MKLHLTTAPGTFMITGYGSGYVQVNGRRYEESLIVLPDQVLAGWAVRAFDDLEARHLNELLPYHPEIVLLGSGARQRFPTPALLADLILTNVGLEVMDTRAACRTYNILAAEGRRVAAALIIET